MKYMILLLTLSLTACKVDLKSDKDKKVDKPQACLRGLSQDIPAGFATMGRPVGAVRTQNCDVIVVGQDNTGETIFARYDQGGNLLQNQGMGPVMRPLLARYSSIRPRIQRLAMINEGFFGIGYFGGTNEPRALFAFRFLDTGLLDNQFGPLNDGVVRGQKDARYSLRSVEAPRVEQDRIVVRGRYEDQFTGTETERDLSFSFTARQPMEKGFLTTPNSCQLLNIQTNFEGTSYQFVQSSCALLDLRASGVFGADALSMVMNGSNYFSNSLGEMRWGYEGVYPVMFSRDGLGVVKKEYVSIVQSRTSICGTNVDSNRRYLVFSPKSQDDPNWLTNCWFM